MPVVRLRSTRDLRHLVDADGRQLAEVSVDAVRAERLFGGEGTAEWTEIEVELADDGNPAFLDKVEKRLRKAGVRPSKSTSKLARALAETKGGHPRPKDEPAEPVTAGDHVLAYVRAQRDAIVDLDPAVRQDAEESVHDMRVATRRLRSTFKSFRKVLDRKVTDPIGDELKWLAAELGVDRDHEVLAERLGTVLDDLAPHPPAAAPSATGWAPGPTAEYGGARRRLLGVLDSARYLTLLDALDAVVAEPAATARRRRRHRPRCSPRPYARTSRRCPRWSRRPWSSRPAPTATSPCTRPARRPSAPATPPRRRPPPSAARPRRSPSR